MEELQNRQVRVASVFLAPGIVLVVGFVTWRCMQAYLKSLHSDLGVPWGISLLVLGLLFLLVIAGVFACYRLVRFALRGI